MTKEQMIEIIATKVMGYTYVSEGWCNGLYIHRIWQTGPEPDQRIHYEIFDPLTNIQQAIEALEKYCENRWYTLDKETKYSCTIFSDDSPTIDANNAESLSEAICLAIIEAIGEEVEG